MRKQSFRKIKTTTQHVVSRLVSVSKLIAAYNTHKNGEISELETIIAIRQCFQRILPNRVANGLTG